MIVVMTMWLPRLACSQPGMKPQAAPNSAGGHDRQRQRQDRPGSQPQIEADQPDAEPAEIGLALAADVEQPGMEGDRDREAGEDEVGGVVERVADRLDIAEGAVTSSSHRLERVLADEEHDEPGDQEGERGGSAAGSEAESAQAGACGSAVSHAASTRCDSALTS